MDLVLTNPMNPTSTGIRFWYCKNGNGGLRLGGRSADPLKSLRFSDEENQVWGLHCWRWIDRLKEEDDWEVQEQNSPGMLYLFGHLKGP